MEAQQYNCVFIFNQPFLHFCTDKAMQKYSVLSEKLVLKSKCTEKGVNG